MNLNHSSYKKALIELSSFDNPSEGFVFQSDTDTTGVKLLKLSKQNNCLINLLIQLHEKVDSLEEKLKQEKPSTSGSSTELDDLVSKLSNLSISLEKQVHARKEHPFYVFKDPKLILKEEIAKLNGSKN